MRTAFVALVGLAIVGASSGCTLSTVTNPDGSVTVTGKSKTRFVSDQKPVREIAFTNQTIEVLNDGVNPGSGVGIVVTGSPGATKVTATSSIVAWADGAETENAKTAQKEVVDSFTVTEAGGKITVRCGHASKDYGTASRAGTGCEGLTVTVPAGTAAAPVSLVVKNGNSDIQVSGITGSVTVEAQGAGDAEVSVTPAQGSVISVSAEFDALLRLPANFAADVVTLAADEAKDIDTSAFPEVKSGLGYGAPGTGAKSITVRSTGLIGTAKIVRQ